MILRSFRSNDKTLLYKTMSKTIIPFFSYTCICMYVSMLKCRYAFGRGGSLDIGRFDAFRPQGCGFESCSGRHVGNFDKSFTRSCLWCFDVKLRHSIRAESRAPLSSGGLEEALYRNSLNEHLCMYLRIYECMHVFTYLCMYVSMHICTYEIRRGLDSLRDRLPSNSSLSRIWARRKNSR